MTTLLVSLGGTVPSTTLSYSPYSSLNTYNNFQWYKDGVSLGAAGNASTYNATLPGTYYFTTTSSNCGNRTSPSIVVNCGTNSYATSNNFTGLTNITGGTIIFDGQITIAAGAVVNISGATIIMQQNSSITIQKHSSTGNGGELNLTSCNISSCGDWQGIFVRGMSTAKDVSNGLLYMRSSSIRDANIAIYGDNCARIDVQSTNFDNNYSHLQLNHYNNVTSGHGPDILFSGCNFNALMPAAPLSGLPGFVLAVLNSPKRPMAYLYDVKSVSFLTCTFGCTNYATPPDQIGIDVFDAMGTSSSISGVNAWDCDFTGEFNTAIYMNNGNWSEIGSSGLPTTVTGSFIDGVAVLNGSEVIIQYTDITHASGTLGHTGIKIDQTVNINLHDNKCKYFTNGMEYYFDQSISTNNTYSVLNGNTFDYNTYGLVYAPVCYPTGNVSCNNGHRAKHGSNTSAFDFTCNRFEHNDWGFVGTGDMDDQGSSGGDDWGGFFGDCTGWDNSTPAICTTYVSTSAKADIAWYDANTFNVYFYPTFGLYFNSACSLLLDNHSVDYLTTNCPGSNSTYENSCFSSFKTDPNASSGTKSFDIKNEPLLDSIVKIFPNPNNGSFFMQNHSKSLYNYKVYNAIGQLVCQGYINADKTEPIHIITNPTGFYNIVVEPMGGEGKRQVFKIIKTND